MIRKGLLKVTTKDDSGTTVGIRYYRIVETLLGGGKNAVMYCENGYTVNRMRVVYDVDLTNTDVLDDMFELLTEGSATSCDYEWTETLAEVGGGELLTGANLNDIMEPGIYYRGSTADTITNVPDEMGNSTWTLEVFHAGDSGQLTQRITRCFKTRPIIMQRSYYTSAWGDWMAVSLNGQKVLWSGAWYMKDTHTAELSENISDQENGIVLVFSSYLDGVADNSSFTTKFIPKKFVELQPGRGISISMQNSTFSKMAVKYLYINDDSIDGHSINDQTGTGASGVTYTNNAFVLRYVLGV